MSAHLDRRGYSKEGPDLYRGWVRLDYSEDQKVSGTEIKYSYWVQRLGVDCKKRTYKLEQGLWYDKDKKLVHNAEGSNEWLEPVPETLGEQLIDGLCPFFREYYSPKK